MKALTDLRPPERRWKSNPTAMPSRPGSELVWATSGGKVRSRKILAFFLVLYLSGVLLTVGFIWPYAQWVVLVLIWITVPFAGKLDIVHGLSKEAKRFLAWLLAVVVTGIITSPIVPVYAGVRTIGIVTSVLIVVWFVGSNRAALRFAGIMASMAIMLNLLVTLLTMSNGLVRVFFIAHQAASQSSAESYRYAGLWGNGNEGSLQCLVLIALSIYGPRWATAAAFLSGAAVIFCTASRTGTYLFLLILAVYAYYFLRQSKAFRLVAILTVFVGGLVFIQSILPQFNGEQVTASVSRGTGIAWTRLLDPLESQTDQSQTRLANFHTWQPFIERVPWYGYGFNAEAGSAEANSEAAYKDFPFEGTHNVYLGILIDNGIFGLLGFIFVLSMGLIGALKAKISSYEKLPVIAIWLVVIIFGMFAHSLHLTPFGAVMFALSFLAPTFPALATEMSEKTHLASELTTGPKAELPYRTPAIVSDPGRMSSEGGSKFGFRRPGRVIGSDPRQPNDSDLTGTEEAPLVGFRKPGRPKNP